MMCRFRPSLACPRLSVLLLLAALASPARGNEAILVSAAASLSGAFHEIAARFTTATGTQVACNVGASGLLQRQIEAGAPVDVFASAGAAPMDALAARGLIEESSRRIIARNSLVVVVPRGAAPPLSAFAELLAPGVRRIAIGNPKTVPAGRYAQELLRNLGLWEALAPRLVFGEDVRQVLDYVVRQEVEAGLVYATEVAVAGDATTIALVAPAEAYTPIVYPVAVVRATRHRDAAARFTEFVAAADGQRILQAHGFPPAR